jgi:hypothetical protein
LLTILSFSFFYSYIYIPKAMIKTITLLIGIPCILISCAAPQSPATKTNGKFTYGIITLDTQANYSMIASSAKAEGYDTTSAGVKDTLIWPSVSIATALFGDSASTSWYNAGTVTFNGVSLPIDSGNYINPGAPVYFTGGYQNWSVQGSGSVPAISDSLQGPFDSVTISAPSNAANVSEASNLTITWNAGNSAETALLIISPSGGGQGFSDEISGSLGTYVIPSTSLSLIPKGHATISISRGVYKIGRASNGQNYIMVTYADDSHDIILH